MRHLIELLAGHETAISDLYEYCAGAFPKHRDFWLSLVHDERTHAEWIRHLNDHVEQGVVFLNEERFNPAVVRESIGHIRAVIKNAAATIPSHARALVVALEVEQTMIERRFFEVFDSPNPELKHIIDTIIIGTHAHINEIRSALAGKKQGD